MNIDWGFYQEEPEYNIVDNAAAICAGVAGYTVSKRFMTAENAQNGAIIEAGISIIAGFIGLKIAESVRKKSYEIRTRIQSRGDRNGECESGCR